jgi:hypothetical protein
MTTTTNYAQSQTGAQQINYTTMSTCDFIDCPMCLHKRQENVQNSECDICMNDVPTAAMMSCKQCRYVDANKSNSYLQISNLETPHALCVNCKWLPIVILQIWMRHK